jgi:hypothetical protein
MIDGRLVLPIDGRQSETALMIGRGVRRLLRAQGFSSVTELPLIDKRRADIVAINAQGEVLIVEIKSSPADLRPTASGATTPPVATDSISPFLRIPRRRSCPATSPHGGLMTPCAGDRPPGQSRFAQAAADRLHRIADPAGAPDL